eukprot:4444664-Amphidinium_carterae.1
MPKSAATEGGPVTCGVLKGMAPSPCGGNGGTGTGTEFVVALVSHCRTVRGEGWQPGAADRRVEISSAVNCGFGSGCNGTGATAAGKVARTGKPGGRSAVPSDSRGDGAGSTPPGLQPAKLGSVPSRVFCAKEVRSAPSCIVGWCRGWDESHPCSWAVPCTHVTN